MRPAFLIAALLPLRADSADDASGPKCKCFPNEACWPSEEQWSQLNRTVGGRLIGTTPLGSPCHDPNFDAEACALLQEQWLYSGVHMKSSSSIMAPLFANQSCDPFTPREKPCTLGNYVSYTVNATNVDDIVATLGFAQANNIRIAVRNTGHDYLGRSTGPGSVAIWTSFLKRTSILDWEDDSYTGKALKIGAGVQGFEALAAAKEAGLVVVTGECPTVGLAGGYLQAGGHSALSTNFGLAADNTLSFEVVTVKGELVTASSTENSDLFWALSGGGGGNFGVVISATIKAHADAAVRGGKFLITTPEAPHKIFEVIDAWHAALPDIVDAGIMVIYFFGDTFLQIPALTAYGKTMNELTAILDPFFESVAHLNIVLDLEMTEFGSYHEHYERYWGPLPEGNIQVGTQLFGGRLIPRAVLPRFGATARTLAEMGVIFIGVGLNVSRFDAPQTRAVLPQWRTSIVQASLTLAWNFSAPWQEMVDAQNRITNEVQPVIEAATPGAGAYINEADFQQQDWAETFYGTNYEGLLAVKKKWDPEGLLWVKVGVGSEEWELGGDGRLCKVGSGQGEVNEEEEKEKEKGEERVYDEL